MLAHHHGVNARWIFKRQEGETPGPPSRIAHDSTCIYFTELRKVVPERVWYGDANFSATERYSEINDDISTIGCIPVESANEHLAIDSNLGLARAH